MVADSGRIDHRPRTQKPPVEGRAAQQREVGRVRPVSGLHRTQIDGAFLDGDIHLTPKGHSAVATALREAITL